MLYPEDATGHLRTYESSTHSTVMSMATKVDRIDKDIHRSTLAVDNIRHTLREKHKDNPLIPKSLTPETIN